MADTDLTRVSTPGPDELAAVALWLADFRATIADRVKEADEDPAVPFVVELDRMGCGVALEGLDRCVVLLGFARAAAPAGEAAVGKAGD